MGGQAGWPRNLLLLAFLVAAVPLFAYLQLLGAGWVWRLNGAELSGHEGFAFGFLYLPLVWLSTALAAGAALLVTGLKRLTYAEALVVDIVFLTAVSVLMIGATAIYFVLT